MHKSFQNDIKNKFLPKLTSNNATSDMSSSSSEHDAGGEEVCSPINFVNGAVPTTDSTHQSGGQETGCEATAGNCQSDQEVKCSGNCQQSVQNVRVVTTHCSPSENRQQEDAFETILLECSVTTQKSNCQADLEVCNDSSLLNGPQPFNDATLKEAEMNGCDVDVSPDQIFKEFVEDPSVILTSVDGFQINEQGSDANFSGTVQFLDGREKFSENSDQSQQINVKSYCYKDNNTPVVCDRADQMCTYSISFIKNEAEDYGATIQVELDKDAPSPSSDLYTIAEETCCNPELLRTLAACVVDEIVEEASKSVSQLKSCNVKEISLKHEKVFSQVSDNGEQALTKSPSEMTACVTESLAIVLDLSTTSELKSINDIIPNASEEIVSENEIMLKSSPCNISESQSNCEQTSQDQQPVICNGNISLLNRTNHSSVSKSIVSGFDVSVAMDCDKEAKKCVVEGSEAKASSNDCSICSTFVNREVEYSSDIISMRDSVGEDVQAVLDVVNSNICLNDVNFVSNENLEAKVDRSNDESFGTSSTEPDRSSLEDSLSVEHKENIATSSVTISDLSCKNSKGEDEDLILNYEDQRLEVEKSLRGAVAPQMDLNVDSTDFVFANAVIDSNDVDYSKTHCIPVNDETVCLELSVAKVENITDKEAGCEGTSFQEMADCERESFHVLENLVSEGVHCITDEKACVSVCNYEKSVADKPVFQHKTDSNLISPIIEKSECSTEKLEMTAGEEKADVVISTTDKSECTSERLDKGTGNLETATEENDPSSEKPLTVVEQETTDVEAIAVERECTSEKADEVVEEKTVNVDMAAAIAEERESTSEKADEVVEEKTVNVDMAAAIAEERESTSEKVDEVVEVESVKVDAAIANEKECISGNPDISLEERIAHADSVVVDTFQVDTEISATRTSAENPIEENPKDDPCASMESSEENSLDLLPEVTAIPHIKVTPSNSGGRDVLTTAFIVPIVNVCPPITEETYDGLTDDESEISHATSDSESDSNVKMGKPVCDGINTINYRPLLDEDSNDRSTLSLISELDEASVREETEQWDNESVSLISDDGVDRLENTVSNSEIVQRVKGHRIRHDNMVIKLEDKSCSEEESVEDTLSAEYAAKIKDIKEALKCSDSLERLRELAQSAGGLVTDEIRRKAWPRLLDIDSSTLSLPLPPINTGELHAHKEYNQVVLDVNRSLRRFPSKITAAERANLQNQLTEIILRVLVKRGDLSYYQGYHDVAVTTLLVAGKDIAFHILERISVSHLSDCMLPTMERTIYLLNYIYPLLQRINPTVVERMDRLEIGTIFCLPWYLTWYGYSLNRYEDIVRLFDYFLASPPLAPLYLAAVVVGRRSAEVLAADSDHATVHALLSRIPESLPLEDLLQEALDLYRQYPPEKIKGEVEERCERLRKAQEEEEEQRRLIRQRRMRIQRRHSMPTIAARQMPGWYYFDRFLGYPIIQRNRLIQVSATVFVGVIAWHLRNEMYRYF